MDEGNTELVEVGTMDDVSVFVGLTTGEAVTVGITGVFVFVGTTGVSVSVGTIDVSVDVGGVPVIVSVEV